MLSLGSARGRAYHRQQQQQQLVAHAACCTRSNQQDERSALWLLLPTDGAGLWAGLGQLNKALAVGLIKAHNLGWHDPARIPASNHAPSDKWHAKQARCMLIARPPN